MERVIHQPSREVILLLKLRRDEQRPWSEADLKRSISSRSSIACLTIFVSSDLFAFPPVAALLLYIGH